MASFCRILSCALHFSISVLLDLYNPYRVIIQNPVAMATFDEALVNELKAKLLPSPVKSGSKYMSFTEAYGSAKSKEAPILPIAKKNKNKFSLGWSPHPRNIKCQINCSQCGTRRMVFSRKNLSAQEQRDLNKIISDMDDFTCGCDISGDLTEASKPRESV